MKKVAGVFYWLKDPNGSFTNDGSYKWLGVHNSKNGARYHGEWLNEKKNGLGFMRYSNGNVYQGEYKQNKRHGHGRYTYADGSYYEGEWFNHKKHGIGKEVSVNGIITEGEWKDGEPWNTVQYDPQNVK